MKGLLRHRGTLLITTVVALAVLVLVLSGRNTTTSADLDPANPDPNGAQAVVNVLADHGVDIDVVRSRREFTGLEVGSDTTVVVSSTENLGQATAAEVLEHSVTGQVILLAPPPELADALRLPVGSPVGSIKPRAADCTDPRLSDLSIESSRHVTTAEYPTPQGCFGGERGFLVGWVSQRVTVLGATGIVANGDIQQSDNAAAALRLLGERPHLIWYVPSLSDQGAGDATSLRALAPRWIGPGLFLGLLTVIGLMLWRGRRLGALAVEPLPVTVKAIEATESRGRLYRKMGQRSHAATVLREGARRRLTARLHLPTYAPGDLAVAVAAASGRPVEQVRALLESTTPPRNDRELIALASQLAELEGEVRRT